MEIPHKENCACKKEKNGVSRGILYGLVPHTFCILFIIFSVLGITVFSSILRPFLSVKYSFQILVGLSLILATLSAVIYLKKSKSLSWNGARKKWKYLSSLYASVILVNLTMIYMMFPALANIDFLEPSQEASINPQGFPTLTLKVEIPCSGHSSLIINELKKAGGIEEAKFRMPNYFDVNYDPKIINEEQILSLQIFNDFSVQKVVN